jgi:hypothetical protein
MKGIKLYMLACVLLLIATSCAVTDIDKRTDFTSYRTFTWGKAESNVENPVYESELISKNIRSTIEKEFAKRGISEDPTDPDFVVSYKTFTEQKPELTSGGYYGYPRGLYPWRFYRYHMFYGLPYGWSTPRQERTYTEGTLMIDITDKKTKELVWRGVVKGNVEDLSALQKQIQKGIKAIMKKYPVTPQDPLPLMKDEKTIS